MAGVDLFGTLHIDRPKKVENELYEFTADADVLFVEDPRDQPDASDRLAMLLRNPAVWLVGRVLYFIWGMPGFILTRRFDSVDSVASRTVARERNLDVEPVDMNIPRQISDVRLSVTIISWIWFLLTVIVVLEGLLWLSSILIIGAMTIGFAPVVPLAYLTLSERNTVMAENIEEVFSTRDDVEAGCLVAGRNHLDGVGAQLEDSWIEVGQRHTSKFLRRSL